MPNARKKKQAKNEDFKKTRLKVGKKKAVADNFTDTSFKSKTISLPNQSITEDKSNLLTNSRNLTLSALLTQMRHYSANTRKEAIQGVQDMCEKHPGIISASLSAIVNASLKILVDEDRDVRKALLEFLKSSLPNLDKTEILPFLSLLTIYTCSAITHIYEDVRADANKFMDLWIELAPEFIVSRYWDKVLGNYISLVAVDSNASNISKSSVSGLPNITANMSSASVKNVASKSSLHSHKAKVEILSSIFNLLNAGLARGADDPYWFFCEYLGDQGAKKRFRRRFGTFKAGSDKDQVSWRADISAAYRPRDLLSQSYAPSLNNNIYATSSYAHLNLFESIEANSGTTNSSKEQGNLSTSKTAELSGKSEGNDLHNIKVGACEVAVRLRDLN
ncbi:rRNA processing protein [Umbelopsis nana]